MFTHFNNKKQRQQDLFPSLHPESSYGAPNQIKEHKLRENDQDSSRTNLERVHQILHQEESSQLFNNSVDVHQNCVTILMDRLSRDCDILIQIHPVQKTEGLP